MFTDLNYKDNEWRAWTGQLNDPEEKKHQRDPAPEVFWYHCTKIWNWDEVFRYLDLQGIKCVSSCSRAGGSTQTKSDVRVDSRIILTL